MKKFRFLLMATLAVVSIALTSCKDDDDDTIIFDYAPFEIVIKVTNSAGNDLLSQGGSMYGKNFKMQFDGEDYEANWDARPDNRAIMPIFSGLVYVPANNNSDAVLKFGQLDAGPKNNYQLSFLMPDGKSHAISIVRVPEKKDDLKQTVKLDGKVLPEYDNGNPYIKLTIIAD